MSSMHKIKTLVPLVSPGDILPCRRKENDTRSYYSDSTVAIVEASSLFLCVLCDLRRKGFAQKFPFTVVVTTFSVECTSDERKVWGTTELRAPLSLLLLLLLLFFRHHAASLFLLRRSTGKQSEPRQWKRCLSFFPSLSRRIAFFFFSLVFIICRTYVGTLPVTEL